MNSITLFSQVQLLDIRIIGNRNNDKYWTNSSIVADNGDFVRLSYILNVRPSELYSSVYISPFRNIILDGDTLEPKLILTGDELLNEKPSIRWYRVVPVELDSIYINYTGFVSPYAVIRYQEDILDEWKDKSEINLNSLTDYLNIFPGTVWLKMELYYKNSFISSEGSESRFKVYGTYDFGGLSDDVFRISFRGQTGSKLLDNVLLYRNIPLIQNPRSFSNQWADHQTINWIGGNLVSFTVAAAGWLGQNFREYLTQLPLPEYNYFQVTDYYCKNAIRAGDYYNVGENEKINLNKHIFYPGDFIISKTRTALFYEDKSSPASEKKGEANGLLDRFDLVLECNNNSLQIGTVQDVLGDTVSLIRWNKRPK